MAATFDAKNTFRAAASQTTYGWTHTPVGTPTLVTVAVMGRAAAGPGATTATYGGTGMTPLAGFSADAASPFIKVFYLVAPAAGPQAVSVSFANAVLNGGGTSWSWLGSKVAPDNVNYNAATFSVDTRTVSNTRGTDQTFEAVSAAGKTNQTPNSGQTEDQDDLTTNASSDQSIASYHKTASAGSTTLGVTQTLAGAVASAHGAARVASDPVGNGASTNANDTASGAAAVSVQASGAGTEAADTAASAGKVAIAAAGAATEGLDSLSATAVVTDSGATGDAAITEALDTASATGQVAIAGAGAATEALDALSASGQVAIRAADAISEAGDSISAAAKVDVRAAGSGAEGMDTLSAAGRVAIQAAGAATEAADVSVASGKISVTGAGAASNADDTLLATAHIGSIAVGDAAIVEGIDLLLSTATVVSVAPAPPPIITVAGVGRYFRSIWQRQRAEDERQRYEQELARQAAFAEMARQAQDALDAREKAMIEEDDIEVLTLLL